MPRNIKSKPFSEINVTPFVDVMLVLLIIFMVTAPLLTVGVQVDLPESNADSLQSDNEPLELTISKDGNIYICLLYTSPSPRDATLSRMPSSA